MRRSTSRTDSVYSSSFNWSVGPSSRFRSASLPFTASSRLLCWRSRASRAERSVLPLSPKIVSNTARGFHSIGSGWVGLRHEIVCV